MTEEMTIIEQLKKNEKRFCEMSPEMQKKLKTISPEDIECLQAPQQRDWNLCSGYSAGDIIRHPTNTYRLRADYEEKPEIVECEINKTDDGSLGYRRKCNGGCGGGSLLFRAFADPDFIGFKFEDGTVSALPVLYSVPGVTPRGYFALHDDIENKQALEHHAIAVLFRGHK